MNRNLSRRQQKDQSDEQPAKPQNRTLGQPIINVGLVSAPTSSSAAGRTNETRTGYCLKKNSAGAGFFMDTITA
jgi:hypothetical protein